MTTKENMKSINKTARIAGILYLLITLLAEGVNLNETTHQSNYCRL